MVFYHRWWWYLVEVVYLMGQQTCHSVWCMVWSFQPYLWEDGVSAKVESWSGFFAISMFLRSGVFTGVCCWSSCEAVYSIGCWDMLQIPWLFLDGLPLLVMVFMLVVSLLNSLQEAMLTCSCTVVVVSKQFLPMQNEN